MFRTEVLRTNLGATGQPGASASSDFVGIQSGLRANLGQVVPSAAADFPVLVQSQVRINFGIISGREKLITDRTYYISPSGSNNSDGKTAGSPFATPQQFIDIVSDTLDIGVYTVTGLCAAGTYTGQIALKPFTGSGTVILRGDTATPANVILSNPGDLIFATGVGVGRGFMLDGFRVTASAGGSCIYAEENALINFLNLDFSDVTGGGRHIFCNAGGIVFARSDYSISGGAANHFYCEFNGQFFCKGRTVNISNNPNFPAGGYAVCSWLGIGDLVNSVFNGSAQGIRYVVEKGGYLRGSLLSTIPGNGSPVVIPPGFYST